MTSFRSKPKPPATVSASAGTASISVTWPTPPGAGKPVGGFILYRNGVEIASLSAAVRSYSDTGMTTNVSTSYAIATVSTASVASGQRTSNVVTVVEIIESGLLFEDDFDMYSVGDLPLTNWERVVTPYTSTENAQIVAAENGITPRNGTRMLRSRLTTATDRMESKSVDPDASASVYLNPTGRDRPYYYVTHNSSGVDITPSGIKAGLENGFWYGFSVCVPSAALLAEDTTTFHRICQIHTDQDSGTGEIGRYPLFSLKLTKSSVWQWGLQHYSSDVRTQLDHSHYNGGSAALVNGIWTWTPSGTYGSATVDKGASDIPALGDLNADRGTWVDWVINAAFDWRNLSPAQGSKGKLDLYKNGVLVYQYRGPLGFNDQYGPYFKMGYYTGSTWPTNRTIYHDSCRYADPANGSYDAVRPR